VLAVSIIGAALELAMINLPGVIRILSEILFYAVMLLYPVFFMGGKRKERIFFSIVNCVIFLFSVLLGALAFNALIGLLPKAQLSSVFFVVHIVEGTSWVAGLVSVLFTIIVYALLVLLITRLNTEGKRFIPRKYWTGMLISFIIIVIGLEIISNLGAWVHNEEQMYTYIAISSVAFLIIWLLLYFVFYFVSRYFTKATEANALVIQNEMIERYLLRKQASDERTKMLNHDLKHSLVQWRALAEEKGDATALQSISEYERQLSASLLINVENESANAIINQKYLEANQAHVEFQVNGAFHKDLCVSKLDLCSLLGNLLDNAIEAAAQAETDDLRLVRLAIRRKGNLLILIVENGYKFVPVLENGDFATRKEDKDFHAIGTLSIKHVAEKYAGVVSNSYENNWFKATVMLCGYTNSNVLSDEN